MNVIWEWRFTKNWNTWKSKVDLLKDKWIDYSNLTIIDAPSPVDIRPIFDAWLEQNCVELIDQIISNSVDIFCSENTWVDELLAEESLFWIWEEMYNKTSWLIDWCDSITKHTTIQFDDTMIVSTVEDILSKYNDKIAVALKKKYINKNTSS